MVQGLVQVSNLHAQYHKGELIDWSLELKALQDHYQYPRHIGSGGATNSIALKHPLFVPIWKCDIGCAELTTGRTVASKVQEWIIDGVNV